MHVALLLVLVGPLAWSAKTPHVADESQLRQAWAALSPKQKNGACEMLRSECRKLSSPPARTVAWVLDHEPTDPGLYPEPMLASLYAAALHAPAYSIERSFLPADDPRSVQQRAQLLPNRTKSMLRRAYTYDWSRGTVVRLLHVDQEELLFENMLHGFYPGEDLALAIATKGLDDGSERRGFAAFGHGYVGNEGEAFVGVTLLDAFLKGKRVDLPDVDALGLLHDTYGDWDSWISPIRDQEGIYALLGEEFRQLKRYRNLREALAETLFASRPNTDTGLHLRKNQLHALWIRASYEPGKLKDMLPGRKGYGAFMQELGLISRKQPELSAQARAREAQIRKDRELLQRVLKRVLERVLERAAAL